MYLVMAYYGVRHDSEHAFSTEMPLSEVFDTAEDLADATFIARRESRRDPAHLYAVEGEPEYPAGCWWNPVFRAGAYVQGGPEERPGEAPAGGG